MITFKAAFKGKDSINGVGITDYLVRNSAGCILTSYNEWV